MEGDLRVMALVIAGALLVGAGLLLSKSVIVTNPGALAGGLVLAQAGILAILLVVARRWIYRR